MRRELRKGFTLIELMIVVAILAILAAIAIPGLLRARISSHETSAVGSMKALVTAQEQFKSASYVDMDADGNGEYGWFQELSGTAPTRGGLTAVPSFLAASFGDSAASGNAPPPLGVAQKSGYNLVIYLPTAAGPAMPEQTPVAAGAPGDANLQELRWACYAWPTEYPASGSRCFFVDQEGEVYFAPNAGGLYDAMNNGPMPGAAYDPAGADPMNLDGQVASGIPGGDGQIWSPIGG